MGSEAAKARVRAKSGTTPENNTVAFPAAAAAVRAATTVELNERYAMVRVGSTVSILDTSTGGAELIKVKDWQLLAGNDFVCVPGEKKPVPKTKIWLTHEDRRTYDAGITFAPGGPPEVATPAGLAYNLFRGWAFEPDPNAAESSYRPFLAHIHDVVCSGNAEAARWVTSFLADIVQRPTVKLGVALVLRGDEGSGKTTIAEVMGKLLGPHYALVDKPGELTGEFNSRLETTLLLCADEAVWGGDKGAAGALKSLVTAPHLSIRRLYHDAVMQPNYTRLIFASNEDWVVPAGVQARRFTMFDVPNTVNGNKPYFRRLWQSLEVNGGEGYRGLLAYLQSFRIDYDFLGKAYLTSALSDQQLRTIPGHYAWWYEVLQAGSLPTEATDRAANEAYKAELRDTYLRHADQIGIRHKAAETQIAEMLRKITPGIKDHTLRERVGMTNRYKKKPYWILPSLEDCRAGFQAWLGGAPILWNDPDADWDGVRPEPEATPAEPEPSPAARQEGFPWLDDSDLPL